MLDTKITVGSNVRIETRHRSPLLKSLFRDIPTTKTYHGVILASESYDPPDTIRITSDDPAVELRVIEKKNILSWNGGTFVYTSTNITPSKPAAEPERITVEGSGGKTYTITSHTDGRKVCTCPGYGFRGVCKHVTALNEKMRSGA